LEADRSVQLKLFAAGRTTTHNRTMLGPSEDHQETLKSTTWEYRKPAFSFATK